MVRNPVEVHVDAGSCTGCMHFVHVPTCMQPDMVSNARLLLFYFSNFQETTMQILFYFIVTPLDNSNSIPSS